MVPVGATDVDSGTETGAVSVGAADGELEIGAPVGATDGELGVETGVVSVGAADGEPEVETGVE